jgi:ubiquinone biosynthesis protein COQ9
MTEIQKIIIERMLFIVPFDGWSEHALKQAAKETSVSDADRKKAFPNGIADCVALFLAEENKKLEVQFPPGSLNSFRMPERIEKLILFRLENWAKQQELIRRTISYNSLPWNSLRTMKTLYSTVDLMWRLAGDSSTDFSFYTRRMTLAGVYSSTVLFWLNDTSENHQETALFLKRRLKNVADFGKFKKKMGCA